MTPPSLFDSPEGDVFVDALDRMRAGCDVTAPPTVEGVDRAAGESVTVYTCHRCAFTCHTARGIIDHAFRHVDEGPGPVVIPAPAHSRLERFVALALVLVLCVLVGFWSAVVLWEPVRYWLWSLLRVVTP